MTLHQLTTVLTTQFAQSPADLSLQPSVEDFPAVLRYDHNMVLALSARLREVLPVVHTLLSPAPRGFSERKAYGTSRKLPHGSLEALQLTVPEAVALARTQRSLIVDYNRGPLGGSYRWT